MKSRYHSSTLPSMWRTLSRAICQNYLAMVAIVFLNNTLSADAQSFSDNFTRSTNSSSVLPWQIQVGNWRITNGVFRAGPNTLDSYGNAYTTNNLTNFTVRADFAF